MRFDINVNVNIKDYFKENIMSDIRILPKTKTRWHKNPISGHEWSTDEILRGYEVWGGLWCMTNHLTLKGAEKEKAHREEMNKKFPFIMPRSERELKYVANQNNGVLPELISGYKWKRMDIHKILTPSPSAGMDNLISLY